MTTLSHGAREYLLSLADDEHMIGARHTSWIGLGPFLEEDLAFCSIAQDELGHAIALYELILDSDSDSGGGDSIDRLDEFAMMRSPTEYRSCHLAERECSAWSDSLVRHWLYDRAETIRWTALTDSTNDRLASIAARALREETFHLAHAAQFMSRISPSQPGQIIESINELLPLAIGIWDTVDGEEAAVAEGITNARSHELAERWEIDIRADLVDWGLDIQWPNATSAARDAQKHRTARSSGFDVLQADLRKVIDLDPTATW